MAYRYNDNIKKGSKSGVRSTSSSTTQIIHNDGTEGESSNESQLTFNSSSQEKVLQNIVEGIRDVFGAYKILSKLDSKLDLGFVIEHLDEVFDDESKQSGKMMTENEDLETIGTVFKAYKMLRKWKPEVASKILIERLEHVLELADTDIIQQSLRPIQEKQDIIDDDDDVKIVWTNETIKDLTTSDSDLESASTSSSSMPAICPKAAQQQGIEDSSCQDEEQRVDSGLSPRECCSFNNMASDSPNEVALTSDVVADGEDLAMTDFSHSVFGSVNSSNRLDKQALIPLIVSYTASDHCYQKSEERFEEMNSPSKQGENEVWICSYCAKTYANKSKLIKHIARCTAPKSFVCKYCKKGFKRKRDWTDHEMIHTGEKPYECKYCKKSFRRKCDVIEHEKIHSVEKPFKCSYCQKLFARRDYLKMHERRHTGEKPYQCKYCTKSFIGHGEMKSHEKVHTSTREKNECKICQKTFLNEVSLKRHEKDCRKELPMSSQSQNVS